METNKYLIERLITEMNHKISGGIYNKLQVDFAYNSNHMEGTQLSHEQTRHIFETNSLSGDRIIIDDVLETINHFNCFKHILNTYMEPLNEDYIKELHKMLKNGLVTDNDEIVIGEYKRYSNTVGNIETSKPSQVKDDIKELLNDYSKLNTITLLDIVIFHSDFEKIHPFYDGNGRVGRLIMLKECLKNDIIPFFINENDKLFYYRGLERYQRSDDIQQLLSTCELMQDDMKSIMDYFEINYDVEPEKKEDNFDI